MPIRDWTRVDAGIFHAFHHDWITELARALNRGALPSDYYALPERHAAGIGPDVLTLQEEDEEYREPAMGQAGVLLAEPKLKPIAETDMAFYRRKQNIVVHHVSGDRIVAMIELVSPGNKAVCNPMNAFIQKAAELIGSGIHLLIVDLFSPSRRDPNGIHGEIWQEIAGQEYDASADRPLTLASYEAGDTVRAYVVPAALGDALTNMPLFLGPRKAIDMALEATYNAAFSEQPRCWRRVLEAPLK